MSPRGRLPRRFFLAASGLFGLATVSAGAAPYITVSLLGSVHGSGDPFSSQVFVEPGDTVDYQVRFQLAAQGATNPYANALKPEYQTITRWVPSNANTSPTAGLNSIRFSLNQSTAAGTIQTDFTTGVTGTTTGGGTWGLSLGSSNGTISSRGNGYHDLNNVKLLREAGNFDGIANDLSPEVITVADGSFGIAVDGTTTTLNLNYNGLAAGDISAAFRWRDAANTANENYQMTVQAYDNSVAGGNPLVTFTGLTVSPAGIAPEPATVGLLALPLILRRRRRVR